MKTKKASDEFKVGKNGIGWVDSSFTEEFGKNKIEKGKALQFQKLPRSMIDSEIIKEFNIQECTLGDVLETLKGATEDLKDGYANLFYIKGHPSLVVRVGWRVGEWYVLAWRRGGIAWLEGGRVFSPATGARSSSPKSSDSLKLETLAARIKELEEWKERVQK